MIGLQPAHIVVIVLFGVLLFAPSRLPLLARGMKKMVSEFRKEVQDPPRSPGSTGEPKASK